MRTYIIRRLLLMIPTIFLVTIIVFCSVRFIPGTVIDLMVSQLTALGGETHDISAEYIKHQLGMDVPMHVQYGRWLKGALHGDLGRSLWTDRLVLNDVLDRLPVSGELALLAMLIGITMALPIGVYSAIRPDTWGDYGGRTISILCISLPTFWVGTILIVYPSILWGWSPEFEYIPLVENPIGNLEQFLLPAAILGTYLSGVIMRMTRTMMLEVLRQDYIRTAWAKGLPERVIIMRHALKNALIPVVTIMGIQFAVVIGGSAILEQIFTLPGLGLFLIEALRKRDYPIISGINLLVSSLILLINLGTDLTYAYLDPRITYR